MHAGCDQDEIQTIKILIDIKQNKMVVKKKKKKKIRFSINPFHHLPFQSKQLLSIPQYYMPAQDM